MTPTAQMCWLKCTDGARGVCAYCRDVRWLRAGGVGVSFGQKAKVFDGFGSGASRRSLGSRACAQRPREFGGVARKRRRLCSLDRRCCECRDVRCFLLADGLESSRRSGCPARELRDGGDVLPEAEGVFQARLFVLFDGGAAQAAQNAARLRNASAAPAAAPAGSSFGGRRGASRRLHGPRTRRLGESLLCRLRNRSSSARADSKRSPRRGNAALSASSRRGLASPSADLQVRLDELRRSLRRPAKGQGRLAAVRFGRAAARRRLRDVFCFPELKAKTERAPPTCGLRLLPGKLRPSPRRSPPWTRCLRKRRGRCFFAVGLLRLSRTRSVPAAAELSLRVCFLFVVVGCCLLFDWGCCASRGVAGSPSSAGIQGAQASASTAAAARVDAWGGECADEASQEEDWAEVGAGSDWSDAIDLGVEEAAAAQQTGTGGALLQGGASAVCADSATAGRARVAAAGAGGDGGSLVVVPGVPCEETWRQRGTASALVAAGAFRRAALRRLGCCYCCCCCCYCCCSCVKQRGQGGLAQRGWIQELFARFLQGTSWARCVFCEGVSAFAECLLCNRLSSAPSRGSGLRCEWRRSLLPCRSPSAHPMKRSQTARHPKWCPSGRWTRP